MIRDRLIAWLLRSRGLCRIGLHMPVVESDWNDADSEPRWVDWRCAACDKRLKAVA